MAQPSHHHHSLPTGDSSDGRGTCCPPWAEAGETRLKLTGGLSGRSVGCLGSVVGRLADEELGPGKLSRWIQATGPRGPRPDMDGEGSRGNNISAAYPRLLYLMTRTSRSFPRWRTPGDVDVVVAANGTVPSQGTLRYGAVRHRACNSARWISTSGRQGTDPCLPFQLSQPFQTTGRYQVYKHNGGKRMKLCTRHEER